MDDYVVSLPWSLHAWPPCSDNLIMRLGVVFAGVCFLCTALGLGMLSSCSSQKGGAAPAQDAGPTDAASDRAVDAGPPDASGDGAVDADTGVADAVAQDAPLDTGAEASPCTGVICNGQCLPATDCHACSGAPLLCAPTHTCGTSCAGCQDTNGAAMPIDCFACDMNRKNPLGSCGYDDAGAYCLSGDYLGQYGGGDGFQCTCNTVADCPGSTQTCVPLGNLGDKFCLTCGEATIGTIQGLPCKDGGACQESQALCQ